MKTSTRVVVIGGGVVGCSVLYHLAKAGWTDIMLIERSELTSGSTWHAAGGFHTLNADTNIAALQGYTIRLYKELEELTGQSCCLHVPDESRDLRCNGHVVGFDLEHHRPSRTFADTFLFSSAREGASGWRPRFGPSDWWVSG